MKESRLEDIELRDTQLLAFRHLLRYIYTGHMSLSNQKDELILEILGLAHQYGFIDLETSISDYLRLSLLAIQNVCLIYDTASLYQLQSLVNACCSFMDRNAPDVIKHESLTCKYRFLKFEIIARANHQSVKKEDTINPQRSTTEFFYNKISFFSLQP